MSIRSPIHCARIDILTLTHVFFSDGDLNKSRGSDMLVIFDQIHCVLNLLAFG